MTFSNDFNDLQSANRNQKCDSMSPKRSKNKHTKKLLARKNSNKNIPVEWRMRQRLRIWFRDNFSASTARIKLHVAQISELRTSRWGKKEEKKRRKKTQTFFVAAVCWPECTWERMQVGRLWVFLFFIFTRHIFSVCHPNDLNIRKQAAAKCARLSFSEEKKRISQKRNKNTKKKLLLKRRPAKRQRQLY